jgi:transposase
VPRRTCNISARGADDPWLRDLLARRPFKVAAVAYAAKMARIIWAMLVTGECYRGRDRRAPMPKAA